MMKRKALDLWAGVFVAMGLGALLFLALKVGNLASFSAAETYLIKANFDNIGGLKKRAPVKSAGGADGSRISTSIPKPTKRRWLFRSKNATSSRRTLRRQS